MRKSTLKQIGIGLVVAVGGYAAVKMLFGGGGATPAAFSSSTGAGRAYDASASLSAPSKDLVVSAAYHTSAPAPAYLPSYGAIVTPQNPSGAQYGYANSAGGAVV